jgi:hypothetical protein
MGLRVNIRVIIVKALEEHGSVLRYSVIRYHFGRAEY